MPSLFDNKNIPGPTPHPEGEEHTQPQSTSRWLDYNTHELLDMISELEDDRRWSRLREGIYLAIFIHVLLISALTWIPKYIFHVPAVIDPIEEIKKRKMQYLDLPNDALTISKPVIRPAPLKPPQVDTKTLERLQTEQPVKLPEPEKPAPEPPKEEAVATPPPTPQPVASAVESPRPTAVPARPNFNMKSQSPIDEMRAAMHGPTSSDGSSVPRGSRMPLHPGAGAGGVQVLSDTQGVDFSAWLQHWHDETQRTWDPLIPDEVNPPIYKRGQVMIRFKVLPNGRLMDGSLVLEGRSGDTALDRAAWGALTGSNYMALPKDFHGPYLELRALFMYNMQPQ